MTRSTNNVAAKNRRKALLKITKGFRGRAKNCSRIARERAMKAMQYSYRDRRNKKRDLRALWIQRINAAVREFSINYSEFISGLEKLGITINRKILSEMAIREPNSFKNLVNGVKNAKIDAKTDTNG
ncbi:MAG: 50S ribosomal protein L20 [Rickettsiales bacterium]|jgi:large subunit ribosomal protein L20|nr:50S ribosomal protein L20 [Rickettsiales bacterium]